MHGRLRSSYCRNCGERSHWTTTLADGPPCPACGVPALAAGARTLELNLVPSEGVSAFDEARHGPATELVPAWVDEVLDGVRP